MPTFNFKDDEGKPVPVDAPDGATESQAFEFFKTQVLPKRRAMKKERDAVDPTAGTSWGQRALENIGGGMMNVVDAVKQWTPGVKGPSDEDIEFRRKADQHLADKTTGGGALQVAGEILPTLLIPGGGFVQGGKLATQGALNLGRIAAGNEAKALALGSARGLGTAAADSAIAGTIGGALQPVTSDESSLVNMAIGGTLGGAMPGVLAAAKKGVQFLTQAGAKNRAVADLIEKLGGPQRASEVLQQVEGHGFGPPGPLREVPLSVGEITQNPTVAMLEGVSRAEDPGGQWATHKMQQYTGRAKALEEATAGADDLLIRQEARDAATGPMRDRALGRAAKDDWFHTPVVDAVEAMAASKENANPAVKKMLAYVRNELNDGITPEKLYEVRKYLSDALHGPTKIGDELSNAIKGADRSTLSMMHSIDSALDTASKGRWTPYLEKYGQKSGPVADAEASALLRAHYGRDAQTLVPGIEGNVVEITGKQLGTQMDKVGANEFGDKFSQETRAALDALKENIQKSEGIQKLIKLTGTSGGGPTTAMNMSAIGKAAAENKVISSIPILGDLVKRASSMEKAALADALRNPDTFIAGVKKKLAQSAPLSPLEDFVMKALRTGNLAMSQNATSQ